MTSFNDASARAEDQLDATFAALADPTRRAIVARLLAGDCTVGDLAAPFDMSLTAVSKHLTILGRAGLLSQRREGRVKWCRLNADSLRHAAIWMEAFGGFSVTDLEALEHLLDSSGLSTPADPPDDPGG